MAALPIIQHTAMSHPQRADFLVALVRDSGYRCDTITYINWQFSHPNWYTLECNEYDYTYNIEDHGHGYEVKAK
jgi:hypothetical protein